MEWHVLYPGYITATSQSTYESYTVRTRPKNDGWMAINDSVGIILGTGMSLLDAKKACEEDAEQEYKNLTEGND